MEKIRILLVHPEASLREKIRARLDAVEGFEIVADHAFLPAEAMADFALVEYRPQLRTDVTRLPASETGGRRALTPRENEVLKLAAEGRSAREIAALLDVSIKTVEAHKVNLMRKLKIHNRAQLVQYAFHNNILRVDATPFGPS
jgi:DNA-binding CsgD family transcriptional regulator